METAVGTGLRKENVQLNKSGSSIHTISDGEAAAEHQMRNPQTVNEGACFENRSAAGRALAAELLNCKVRCSVVLGLARGGVPVAFEVAAVLGVPMDVLVVRRLRSPISEKLSIGAVSADGTQVLREDIIQELGVSEDYLAKEREFRLAEARKAQVLYRGEHPALDLKGAAVVIVGDGMASGAGMEAAVLGVLLQGPKSILVAVPAGSWRACRALCCIADDVSCLPCPDCQSVAQYCLQSLPVSDSEVQRLLHRNRAAQMKAAPVHPQNPHVKVRNEHDPSVHHSHAANRRSGKDRDILSKTPPYAAV